MNFEKYQTTIFHIKTDSFKLKHIVSNSNKMTNMKMASETQCTVVVAGDSRVGKTALIQRFVNKTFQQVSYKSKNNNTILKHNELPFQHTE